MTAIQSEIPFVIIPLEMMKGADVNALFEKISRIFGVSNKHLAIEAIEENNQQRLDDSNLLADPVEIGRSNRRKSRNII